MAIGKKKHESTICDRNCIHTPDFFLLASPHMHCSKMKVSFNSVHQATYWVQLIRIIMGFVISAHNNYCIYNVFFFSLFISWVLIVIRHRQSNSYFWSDHENYNLSSICLCVHFQFSLHIWTLMNDTHFFDNQSCSFIIIFTV